MVRYFPDTTGRFKNRSYYKDQELDQEFETLLESFFLKRLGRPISYPLDTEDLIRLIEERTSDFDQYGDLSDEGPEVEGVTRFKPKDRPEVSISARLSENNRRSNRFRTTLAHEFGHVHLHDPLYQETVAQPDMLRAAGVLHKVVCHRDSITEARAADWLEWQACYASGAILMPRRAIQTSLIEYFKAKTMLSGPIWTEAEEAREVVELVRDSYQVSSEAAGVRLRVLGHLVREKPAATLFG